MKPAIVYGAKSTADVKGSIPTQIEDGKRLAAAKGYEVVGVYHDEAASAFHGNRGSGLDEAMAHCERLGGCALLVQHSDRLARGDGKQARSLMEIVIWAMQHDVKLVSLQDPEILAGGDYSLVMGAIGSMRNNQDSKRKGASVSDGLNRRKQAGKALGGPPQYGYRRMYKPGDRPGQQASYLVLHDEQAAVVRRIYDEYLAGGSHRTVAAGLVRDGVPAPKGGKWAQASVKRVLHNKLYLGVLVDRDGNEVPGQHPAIIERATYDRVQAMARHQSRRTGGRYNHGTHLMTRGLLKCVRCGSTMYPRVNRGRNIYYCGGRLEWGKDYCSQSSLDASVVDGALMDWLTHHLLDMAETRRQLEERTALELAAARQAVAAADQQAAKAAAQLQRVRRDYLEERLDATEYTEMRAEVADEKQAAEREAEQARARLAAVEDAHTHTDVETEVLRAVAEYKALASGVERAGRVDLNAVRMTLRQAFPMVVYIAADAIGPNGEVPGYTDDHSTERGVWSEGVWTGQGMLVPMLGHDSILGLDAEQRPVVKRVPVPLAQLVGQAPEGAGTNAGRAV